MYYTVVFLEVAETIPEEFLARNLDPGTAECESTGS
jgi:hypothetical protein